MGEYTKPCIYNTLTFKIAYHLQIRFKHLKLISRNASLANTIKSHTLLHPHSIVAMLQDSQKKSMMIDLLYVFRKDFMIQILAINH